MVFDEEMLFFIYNYVKTSDPLARAISHPGTVICTVLFEVTHQISKL